MFPVLVKRARRSTRPPRSVRDLRLRFEWYRACNRGQQAKRSGTKPSFLPSFLPSKSLSSFIREHPVPSERDNLPSFHKAPRPSRGALLYIYLLRGPLASRSRFAGLARASRLSGLVGSMVARSSKSREPKARSARRSIVRNEVAARDGLALGMQ